MLHVNLGNGNHDIEGAYRAVKDGGEWFIMGKNTSVPCDSEAQANQLLEMLNGKDKYQGSDSNKNEPMFSLFPR